MKRINIFVAVFIIIFLIGFLVWLTEEHLTRPLPIMKNHDSTQKFIIIFYDQKTGIKYGKWKEPKG